MLTSREEEYSRQVSVRIESLRQFLNTRSVDALDASTEWLKFLSEFKTIQGNLNNDVSFMATLLAKEYLVAHFSLQFDAAEKPQGAPGIDIDVRTADGKRIVAEIKTTAPYQLNDFGANQATSFKKDFAKLKFAQADCKFLFVTERRAFEVLKKLKYTRQIPGVRIVLLPAGDEHSA